MRLNRRVPTRVGTLAVADSDPGEGTGTPVVLWPSLLRDHRLYRHVTALLGPQWRTICVDGPGFGRSDAHGGDVHPDRYAGAVVDLLDELGIETAVVAGCSWGGQVAAHTSVQSPQRTAAVLMMNTPLAPSLGGQRHPPSRPTRPRSRCRRTEFPRYEGLIGGSHRDAALTAPSTPAWIAAHLGAPHRHTVDHGVDRAKIRHAVDTQLLAAVFADEHRAEGIRANPELREQPSGLAGFENLAVECAGAVGDDLAEHHVAFREVTSTGLDSAHRFDQARIAVGGREQKQWAALPLVVTQSRRRGRSRCERSAGRQDDHGECGSDEFPAGVGHSANRLYREYRKAVWLR